jgi:hypothetical protein
LQALQNIFDYSWNSKLGVSLAFLRFSNNAERRMLLLTNRAVNAHFYRSLITKTFAKDATGFAPNGSSKMEV